MDERKKTPRILNSTEQKNPSDQTRHLFYKIHTENFVSQPVEKRILCAHNHDACEIKTKKTVFSKNVYVIKIYSHFLLKIAKCN